ncbi:conjugative transposon protein TraJ [Chitinophaga niabensis]|uniref:Bacteroides conjugative transposon TraJ protein n=1 Tax=Chitinophaga niabensis TaxID=536979 RepID=A0A1N6E4X4_9BACT|nr:conjugative transposon protein TraJ [Chitinophaga niabensis]SIN78105.1 Bacteroides conjugative transposon TraJ protein [Chitinophaga niabensis]
MRKCGRAVLVAAVLLGLPLLGQAQDVADKIHSLNGILDKLLETMMPMCKDLISVAMGIAGFGALWYIAGRCWKHLANAEPIDFYPLFRPFVLGFCISFFPLLLDTVNFLMKPIVTGTGEMVHNTDEAVKVLLEQKKQAMKGTVGWEMYVGEDNNGDREKWYKYAYGDKKEHWTEYIDHSLQFMTAKAMYNFRQKVKEWMSEILKVLFQAASLCINTIRTFQLIVLAILGPLVFGLAVYDGFQHSLTAWLSRYLNVFMWLPVANIFGAIIAKIQEEMLKLDLDQIKNSGDTYFSASDTGYLIFMIIGIVGYFTVPTVAGYIINAGGAGAMVSKVTSVMSSIPGAPVSAATSAIDTMKSFQDGKKYDAGTGISGAIGRAFKTDDGDGSFQHSKLSGRAK